MSNKIICVMKDGSEKLQTAVPGFKITFRGLKGTSKNNQGSKFLIPLF